MTIDKLKAEYRLKVRLDECGDQIIPGAWGHLYIDEGKLCLMATDAPARVKSTWEQLGGRLWMGSVSKNPDGKRVQDVEIKDFDANKVRLACKLLRIHPKRVMSEAQAAQWATARLRSPIGGKGPSDAGNDSGAVG